MWWSSLPDQCLGLCTFVLNWVAPLILPAIWACPAEGSGEGQYISFQFRYIFAGANQQAGFSPWRACVQSHFNQARWSRLLCWGKWQQLPQTNVQSMMEFGLAIDRLPLYVCVCVCVRACVSVVITCSSSLSIPSRLTELFLFACSDDTTTGKARGANKNQNCFFFFPGGANDWLQHFSTTKKNANWWLVGWWEVGRGGGELA